MTISSESMFLTFAGDGATTAFDLTGLHYFQASDLRVYIRGSDGVATLQTITTHYSVTGTDTVAGIVTMVTAPASGETLVVARRPTALQGTNYPGNGKFPSEAHEDALDLLTEIAQYLLYTADRSLRFAEGTAGGTSEIPGGTAEKFLYIDASGNLTFTAGGGDDGANGADGGIPMTWSNATSGTPASGVMRGNAAHASITEIAISETDANAGGLSALLADIDNSTSNVKGYVLALQASDHSKYEIFRLDTALSDDGTFRTATVTSVGGGSEIDNGAAIKVFPFSRTGDKGDTGPAGPASATDTSAVCKTTANVDLAGGGLANGTTHDGVTVATGEQVLVSEQTAPAENGIYTVPVSGASSRAGDYDTYEEHPGVLITVREGTANADTIFQCTSDTGGTLGTTAITWALRFGSATETAEGLIELATTAEVQAGADATRAVTAAALAALTATLTRAGLIEVATVAETSAGTDADRAVSPDGLAGSRHGEWVVPILVFDDSEDCAIADGAGDVFFTIPSTLDGANLVDAQVSVHTAGTTGTMDVQVHNITDAVDMLTTKVTLGSGAVAVSDGVVDGANDDVATNDRLRIDVDAIHTGTAAKGLLVNLIFRMP